MASPKITRVSKVTKVGGEYVVKAWVGADGKTRYPDGDYYTTDRQDALATAARMVDSLAGLTVNEQHLLQTLRAFDVIPSDLGVYAVGTDYEGSMSFSDCLYVATNGISMSDDDYEAFKTHPINDWCEENGVGIETVDAGESGGSTPWYVTFMLPCRDGRRHPTQAELDAAAELQHPYTTCPVCEGCVLDTSELRATGMCPDCVVETEGLFDDEDAEQVA